jgi:hypothetical protein
MRPAGRHVERLHEHRAAGVDGDAAASSALRTEM